MKRQKVIKSVFVIIIKYHRYLYSPTPWNGIYLFQKKSENHAKDDHIFAIPSLEPLHRHQVK